MEEGTVSRAVGRWEMEMFDESCAWCQCLHAGPGPVAQVRPWRTPVQPCLLVSWPNNGPVLAGVMPGVTDLLAHD